MKRILIYLFAMLTFVSLNSVEERSELSNQSEELIDQTLNFARGHQEFKELYFKQHEKEFLRLVQEGQSPNALFIGCSDSRIVPDLLLGTRPGELFVVRTAGNFVPYYDPKSQDGVAATIQYALEVLNIRHIIVCGHSHCGAIQGLFKELNPNTLGLVKNWVRWGEPAKRMALMTIKQPVPKEELYEVTEQLSVIYQLENLLTYPFVKQRVDNHTLELHGWYYTIETGELEFYDPQAYRFKPLRTLTQRAL